MPLKARIVLSIVLLSRMKNYDGDSKGDQLAVEGFENEISEVNGCGRLSGK